MALKGRHSSQQQTQHDGTVGQPVMVRERETIREIVKSRCRFCGKLFFETKEKCQHCGAT
jgi:uncharacterized OB-fold protein